MGIPVFKTLIRYTESTMVSVRVHMNCPIFDVIVVRKSWLSGKRLKAVEQTFEYRAGELSRGKMTVDLGGGFLAHFDNGRLISAEYPDRSDFTADLGVISFN